MRSLPTSRYLRFLTIFMVGFPVFYLMFAAWVYELSAQGLLAVALSPLFYLSSFFWIWTGVGFRRMRKWSWYTFAFAQFFAVYLNALNLLTHSQSRYKVWAFTLSVLLQVYVYVVAKREIRVPYLFPQVRWWESGIAGMTHLPVELDRANKSETNDSRSSAQILDLDLRGCFLKTPKQFEAFEKIRIYCQAYGFNIEIPGVVVWIAESAVTHPKGVGIKFFGLDRNQKKRLKTIALRFQKEKEVSHGTKIKLA